MRQSYSLTDEQLKEIMEACKPVACMQIGGVGPSSQQANANRAWEKLGKEMGFVGDSVQPYGKDPKNFTAEEIIPEPEPNLNEIRIRRDGDQWCATREPFTNLQECPAGFANDPAKAVDCLMVAEKEEKC